MKIELLSPAGNVRIGRSAIDAGADAVYIGLQRFGARGAAGNSAEEIASLTRYAHSFGARVYVTMNTLLLEEELETARRMAWEAWEAGADALIVQDMAFTRMELPPIALHASTQTFNLSPERVRFLAQAGFSRIVLERGATREQIRAIRKAVPDVELEIFVHGAICVCYSGQCYLGHALCGRGGNRGACAQPCRSRYRLTDSRGTLLASDQTLLSVSDLNLSDRLEEVIGAGICSLKIEGRLKEEEYVVNNTAYYHQKLTELQAERSSVGKATCHFQPNPSKTFSRGFSGYYWEGKRAGVAAAEARSVGEELGQVTKIYPDGSFLLRYSAGVTPANNGDGICFLTAKGKLEGTRISRAEAERIFPNRNDGIRPGITIYRNLDRSFRPSAIRRIGADIRLDIPAGALTATDQTGTGTTLPFDATGYPPASNPELATNNLQKGFAKSGDTIFEIGKVEIERGDHALPFLPAAEINRLRRELLEKLLQERLAAYRRPEPFTAGVRGQQINPGVQTDYRANVANSLAEQFYREYGLNIAERAPEADRNSDLTGREVMRTPYCIRRELKRCPKQNKGEKAEPLFLENNGTRLELRFDCQRCEMAVIFLGKQL